MHITTTLLDGRRGWRIANDRISLHFLAGGGHFASLTHVDHPHLNPLWTPPWTGMEPWQYKPARDAAAYESRLLASIRGHNLCLPFFGAPAPSETAGGHGPHGEAPVMRWKLLSKHITSTRVRLRIGCEMPLASLACERTVVLRKGQEEAEITDRVINRLRREIPFAMAQHLTIGPPFLVAGKTEIDCSATRGHTYPVPFEPRPRLKIQEEYTWPMAPGSKGKAVDLRRLGPVPAKSSDFSVQLMDPAQEQAWLRTTTPGIPLKLEYRWQRRDYPFLGLWEEHYGRQAAPWNGKTLCRGIELLNTPFGLGLRDAAERGSLFGQPTFAWLGAKEKRDYRFIVRWSPETSQAE